MMKINFVFALLLLISSCGKHDFNNAEEQSKSRSKREIKEGQIKGIQKTPEEQLREKLNDEQSKGLNFLKEALGDNERLNQLLSLNEDKLKAVFQHIHSEVTTCKSNNAEEKKNTFKALIRGYFESNNNNLDNIVGENSYLKIICDSH